jgi:multidrug efflux pump subunit AcrB
VVLFVLFTGGVLFYAARVMPFELFRNTDISFFFVNVELPPGARLEETERAVAQVEEYLAGQPKDHIEAAVGRVGAIEDQMGQLNYGSNKGQVLVDLMEPEHHPGVSGQDILEEVRAQFPSIPNIAKLEFKVDSGGPPTGEPVNVRISGEDYDRLLPIAKEVQEYLHGVEGVFDIKDNFEWGKEEFRVQVDREKASDLSIDVARVAREVRNAFAGGLATSFTRSKEEVEIYVKFPEESRTSLENLRLMKFRNDRGDLVPFENFAKVEYGQGLSSIGRWDQRRTIVVSADVDTDVITSREINQKLQDTFGFQNEKYPGALFDYAGENEDTEEALTSLLRAFCVAMFVNYAIIATVFNSFMQPLVVMSAIPLAGIGVIVGLLIHGEPMGFMALLGCVALVGIVVNDSIILLDFVNKARLRGLSRWRSLIWAAKVRVRPIILTTLTTIGGLVPMLTGLTGTSTFLVPMAVALVYGLIFATVLLLLVVPVLMSMLDGARTYFGYRLVRPEYDENLLRKSMGLAPVEET